MVDILRKKDAKKVELLQAKIAALYHKAGKYVTVNIHEASHLFPERNEVGHSKKT